MTRALTEPSTSTEETEVDMGDAKPEIVRFDRYYPAEVEIVRGGSGKEVTAYAAVFDEPSEIRDAHGHYNEVIDRTAFRRSIAHGVSRIGCYYNHGYHIDGTPSALGSVPIGSFLEIREDGKGLLTRARYNDTPLAISVLEAIKAGDIKGYSFRGRVLKSDRINRGGPLPYIYRREIALAEAGPTPSPFYASANIVAIRSAVATQALIDLRALGLRERIEVIARAIGDDDEPLAENLDEPETPDSTTEPETVPDEGTDTATATPDEPESEVDTTVEVPEVAQPTPSDEGLGADGPPEEAPVPAVTRSVTAADIARRARVALILRTAGEGGQS